MKHTIFFTIICALSLKANALNFTESSSYFEQLKKYYDQAPRSAKGIDFPNKNNSTHISCLTIVQGQETFEKSSPIYTDSWDNGPLFPISYAFYDSETGKKYSAHNNGEQSLLSLEMNTSDIIRRGQFKTDGKYFFVSWQIKWSYNPTVISAMEYCWNRN